MKEYGKCWLQNDFAIIPAKDELHIWHLPSKNYLTHVSYPKILKTKLNYHNRVVDVKIQSNEIQILFVVNVWEGISLLTAKFALNDPEDSSSVKLAQENPPKKMEAHVVSSKPRIVTAVQSLFRKFFQW